MAGTLTFALPPGKLGVAPRVRSRVADPPAAGMPAHITLMYPFLPPGKIAEPQIDLLRQCFTGFAPFRYSLREIGLFPTEVVYLAPNPAEPFRQMTAAIWNCLPARPPYGGKHPEIVPHPTVAQIADRQRRDRIAEEFRQAARGMLPIAATGSQVALMDDIGGRWQTRRRFRLGVG